MSPNAPAVHAPISALINLAYTKSPKIAPSTSVKTRRATNILSRLASSCSKSTTTPSMVRCIALCNKRRSLPRSSSRNDFRRINRSRHPDRSRCALGIRTDRLNRFSSSGPSAPVVRHKQWRYLRYFLYRCSVVFPSIGRFQDLFDRESICFLNFVYVPHQDSGGTEHGYRGERSTAGRERR